MGTKIESRSIRPSATYGSERPSRNSESLALHASVAEESERLISSGSLRNSQATNPNNKNERYATR